MSIQPINFNQQNLKIRVFNNDGGENKPLSNSDLERIPVFDTVTFQANKKKEEETKISCKEADNLRYDLEYSKPSAMRGNYTISGENLELEVKNKLVGGRDIYGTLNDKNLNLNISSGVLGVYSGKISGVIDGVVVDLKYRSGEGLKNIELVGDISKFDDKTLNLITLLIQDKIKFDIEAEKALMLIAIASS